MRSHPNRWERYPVAKSGQTNKKPSTKAAAPKLAPWLVSSPAWDRVDPVLQQRLAKLKPKKTLAERALKIADLLAIEFPDATCALIHKNALQLLVATILSAQCTDERVNMVTPALFKKYPKARDLASAPPGELENDIRSTGFFNNKAKSIRAACADIDERFGGKVPESMDDLLTLRGVARKTANVVRINCFGYPGLTVDTHFLRITKRLGLTEQEDQEKVEAEVASLLPPDRWSHFCHSIILHGRKTCKARKPACDACALVPLCPSAFKQ